jgi:hypothetical protein
MTISRWQVRGRRGAMEFRPTQVEQVNLCEAAARLKMVGGHGRGSEDTVRFERRPW